MGREQIGRPLTTTTKAAIRAVTRYPWLLEGPRKPKTSPHTHIRQLCALQPSGVVLSQCVPGVLVSTRQLGLMGQQHLPRQLVLLSKGLDLGDGGGGGCKGQGGIEYMFGKYTPCILHWWVSGFRFQGG